MGVHGMKANQDALLIGVGALAFVGLFLFLKKQGAAAVAAVANVNAGTPYAGSGAVGTLGNAANSVSGGVLADLGSWLGGAVYSATHSDPTTSSSGTPLQTNKQAVGDNFFANSAMDWATSGGL